MGDRLKARKPDSFSPCCHVRQNRLAQGLAGLIVQGKRADAGSLLSQPCTLLGRGANIRRMAGFSFFPCHEPDGFLHKAR